jgi:ATP-dependent Clp protease protease subunit
MMDRRLLNLFAANRKKGSFRAESTAAGNVIEIYDVIVSSEIDAEWFGGVSVTAVVRALKAMSGPVLMRINSPGGDVFAGVALAQHMREYDGEIVVQVDGYAASIASIVAIAGDRVIMSPGSMMMIHKSWTFGVGNADDLLAMASVLEKIDGQMVEAYTSRSAGKKTDAEFAEMLRAETWFTPQEAIDAGLADEVAAEKEKSAKQARARWDVSAYAKAPAPASLIETPYNDNAAAKATAEFERDQRLRRAHLLSRTA